MRHVAGAYTGEGLDEPPFFSWNKEIFVFALLVNEAERLHCIRESTTTREAYLLAVGLKTIYEHCVTRFQTKLRCPTARIPLRKILCTPLLSAVAILAFSYKKLCELSSEGTTDEASVKETKEA